MLKSFVTAVVLASAATVVLVAILLGSINGLVDMARADPQGSVDLVAIDMENPYVPGNTEDSAADITGASGPCNDGLDNDQKYDAATFSWIPEGLVDADDPDCWENNEDSVGTIEGCGEIPDVGTHNENPPAAGTTHTFDLVVTGVDPIDKIWSYQFDIDYDETIIEIIGAIAVDGTPTDAMLGGIPAGDISILSRIDSYGGAGFINTSEAALPINDLADVDGSFTVAATDGTNLIAVGTHPPDGHESGEGVLARITVRGIATGQSHLLIPSVDGGFDDVSDTIIVPGDGPLFKPVDPPPIPVEDFGRAAVSVAQECVPPVIESADVQISDLDCTGEPEVATIKNFGDGAQSLIGWKLRSDPVATQVFDLSVIQTPGLPPGQLGGGNEVFVWSGPDADHANANLSQFPWPDTDEKFRDGDVTDFAQIVDDNDNVIDTVNCIAEPTPTPAPPTPTPTPATPTPTPTVTIFDGATGAIFRDVGKPLTTDDEGDGATTDDPVETTVTPPVGGEIGLFNVTISETEISESPPTGFEFFGQQVNIEVKPAATAANPLKIAFLLDSSIIPPGETKTTIEIFKDGVKVPACTDDSGKASPDPCVSSRKQVGDDIEITVLSSIGSLWNFGHAKTTGTAAAGAAAGAASAPPPTGDGIPVDEGGGGSVLPRLFIALGVVIAMAATGYAVYSARGRFTSGRATTRRRLSH